MGQSEKCPRLRILKFSIKLLGPVFSPRDKDVLPLMKDSIDELLLSLDLREDPALLWPTFLILTMATSRWAGPSLRDKDNRSAPVEQGREGGESGEGCEEERSHVTPEEVQAFFLDYHQQKDRENLMVEEAEGEKDVNEEGGQEEEGGELYSQTKYLSPELQAAVDVLQRCTHHLSVPSPSLRLTVLDALGHCLRALGTDEQTLLPEVHKVCLISHTLHPLQQLHALHTGVASVPPSTL